MSQTTILTVAGKLIEVGGDYAPGHYDYRAPAKFIAVGGRAYATAGSMTPTGKQQRAAADLVAGKTPAVEARDGGDVDVSVRDLDGIRVRLTAYAAGCELCYADTTDRALLTE